MYAFKKTLKIAQIAPVAERVPPKKYGGIERMVHALTEELVKRGHEVTLFASGDSITSAKLVSVVPRALREAKVHDPNGMNEWALLNVLNAYKRYEEFDIIHDHNNVFSLLTAQFSKTPVVATIHGAIKPDNKRIFEDSTSPYFVSISKSQTEGFTQIKTIDTVYNGLPMKHYPFSKKNKGYLLYVGRICMQKGTHFAIDTALALDLPLIIAAKVDTVDVAYFKEYVEPRIDNDQIKWVGEVDEKKRNQLMKNALCLLHPVTWREPFGLSLIESMACGCPVIAFNMGSIPEIIVDGKTGFVVSNLDEMIEAIGKLDQIDREFCRSYALKNFNERIMTDRYEDIYYRILYEEDRAIEGIDNRTNALTNKLDQLYTDPSSLQSD